MLGRVSSCGGFFRWMARSVVSCGHDDDTGEAFLFASVVRFPDRHDRNRGWFRCRPPVLPVGRCIGFAVVMAQVRRPVPFRTRKLRPGRGDGTALERVWESSTPPHSTYGPSGRAPSGFPEGPFFVSAHACFPPSAGGFWAYRNFCGALDWFSLSVGGVGVSRGGVEFVPVDAGPVCGRDAVVRFGRRCLFALPQGVGDE